MGVADDLSLTYLTFDSVDAGVGASQVAPYVERLGRRGVRVVLHSFEKRTPSRDRQAGFETAGVVWHPHPFGRAGSAGGALRVVRGARLVRGAPLVHARSDLAAASALLARCRDWVWDVRSFWVDERIRMGLVRAGSLEERVMRRIEQGAARGSSTVITLTRAAVPVLQARHGPAIAEKVRVIPTCVDLARFTVGSMPASAPLRVLFSGSFNPLYDADLCAGFIQCLRGRRAVEVSVLTPADTSRPPVLAGLSAVFGSVPFSEMPERISSHHVGMAPLRRDVGVGLRAAAPTKVAEFLACGRPVVINAGLGDMESLVRQQGCGVVVGDASVEGLQRAADELLDMVADPDTPQRCRRVAERHFDLDAAVDTLVEVYRSVAGR